MKGDNGIRLDIKKDPDGVAGSEGSDLDGEEDEILPGHWHDLEPDESPEEETDDENDGGGGGDDKEKTNGFVISFGSFRHTTSLQCLRWGRQKEPDQRY